MKYFAIIALLASLLTCPLYAQQRIFDEMKIGILEPFKPTSAQVITEFGQYNVWADGKKIAELAPRERITFIKRDKLVEVSLPGKVLGNFKVVELNALGDDGVFRLYLLKPQKHELVYDDHLHISAGSNGALKFVNRVNLEKYIAGVVEAESGKEKGVEYYMVQAIISRTYALNNRRRFINQGYNLNDRVDCQVYHGKARWEPDILEAVRATEHLVLVDSEMKLITAAFHSNSGGETVASELVWSGPLPYLISRRDEFSIGGAHYEWQKAVPKQAWLDYLQRKYKFDVAHPSLRAMALQYEQPFREVYFAEERFRIPLKDIRFDWKLNSTFFDLIEEADSVRFVGRGFGHGAGLSQEGAMKMADIGYTYSDILHFYYNDVHVIDLRNLDFFKEE